MGRTKKVQVEQQKSCPLTLEIKMHIIRFKSKNCRIAELQALDRGAEYLSTWTTKLAKYLMPKDQKISRKDVGRWVKKYRWITSPNPLEVEPKSHAILLGLRREKNLDLNVTARSDIESDDEDETPTRCLGKRLFINKNRATAPGKSKFSSAPSSHNNNNNPTPPIIIKNTGIIGSHELHVTFENGVTIYNTIWTKVVGTDSFDDQNTPRPSHSAHSFVNQNTPRPSPSHSAHSNSSQPMHDPLNTSMNSATSNASRFEERTTLPHIGSEVEVGIPNGENNNPGDNPGNNTPQYYDSIEEDDEDGQFPPIDVKFGYGNGEFFNCGSKSPTPRVKVEPMRMEQERIKTTKLLQKKREINKQMLSNTFNNAAETEVITID